MSSCRLLVHAASVLAVTSLVAGVWPTSNLKAKQAFVSVKGKEPIPREPFKTWSLLLVTNQDWLVPENGGWLQALYHRSQSFGRVIGKDHAAVWFWKQDGLMMGPSSVVANVDVERAVEFCQKLGLKPSRGPYLLFTTTYPDENAPPNAYGVIELGTSAERTVELLRRLGDQLVTEGVIRNGEFQQPVGSDDFWSAWFDATRHALANLGSGLRLAIRTPTLTLEVGRRPEN